MFDRTTSRELESLFAPSGTTQQRIARQVQGLLLLLRIILTLLGPVKGLWDNAFARVLATADGSQLVNGLTLRQWQQYSAAFLAYAVFMKLPLSALAALALPDGTTPFAVFDAEALGDLTSMSFEQIAFSEPESVVPVVADQPIEEGV